MKDYDLPTKPQYLAPNSELEDAIESDPLALIQSNRRDLARMKISLLAGQVECRRYVHTGNIDSLEKDEMLCRNELLGCEERKEYETAQDIRLNHLLRIEKEKRSAHTEYFRDAARIRSDLIEAILEYKAINQRGELLSTIN